MRRVSVLSWARSVSFRRRSKSNILRFLQEKCLQWVGGLQEIHSDARVLAATNRNLQESMAGGKFREDLYFRLAVVVVKVPPAGAGGRHRPGGEGFPAQVWCREIGRASC